MQFSHHQQQQFNFNNNGNGNNSNNNQPQPQYVLFSHQHQHQHQQHHQQVPQGAAPAFVLAHQPNNHSQPHSFNQQQQHQFIPAAAHHHQHQHHQIINTTNTSNNNNNNNNNNNTNAQQHFATLQINPAANNALHHIPSYDEGVRKGFQDGFEAGKKEATGEAVNLKARVVHLQSQVQKLNQDLKKLQKQQLTAASINNNNKQQSGAADDSKRSGTSGGGEGDLSFTDFAKPEGDQQDTDNTNNNTNKDVDDITWHDSVSNRGGGVGHEQSMNSLSENDDNDNPLIMGTSQGSDTAAGRRVSLVESIESREGLGSGSLVNSLSGSLTSLKSGADSLNSGASGSKQHVITATPTSHINYLYTSLDSVVYERFEPGKVFAVALPKSKLASHRIASECLLKTQALEAPRHVLTHCAHYYFNRICNRGVDCCFVHAVSVPDIRVWGKTIERQPIEFVGTSTSASAPTTTVVFQQQQQQQQQQQTNSPLIINNSNNTGVVSYVHQN